LKKTTIAYIKFSIMISFTLNRQRVFWVRAP